MTGDADFVAATFALDAPPAAAWALIRDFANVAAWNPFLSTSRLVAGRDGEAGAVREVVTADGTVVREELKRLDEAERTLGYRMLTFPLPVAGQLNTIRVASDGQTGCRVTFDARFTPLLSITPGEVTNANRVAFATAARGIAAKLCAAIGEAYDP